MINNIKDHFGMMRIPFSKEISNKDLFQSNSLKCVKNRLELAIENEDFALISGSAGSGKSSAVRFFLSQIDPKSYPQIYITAEKYKIGDIAKLILHQLNAEVPYNGFTALRQVKTQIKKLNSENNAKPIIVIDEAHELPTSTLSSIKNMTNFEFDSKSCVTFILVGQSKFLNIVNMTELASLRRRIRIRYKIDNLSVEESMQYINHQLKYSGVTREIFSEEVKSEIFRLSNGLICNINNICYDLIINAVENSKDIIEPSMLERILQIN